MGKLRWKTNRFLQHLKLIILLLLIQTTLSSSEDSMDDDFDEELNSVIHAVGTEKWAMYTKQHRRVARDLGQTQDNTTFWSSIYDECHKRTTFSCIKTGVFKYLDRNLEHSGNVQVTDGLCFSKNLNKYSGMCENSVDEKDRCDRYNIEKMKILNDQENQIEVDDTRQKAAADVDKSDDGEDDITEDDERSLEGFSDVSNLLYDKGTQFLMTHDVELQLPEMFFGGGSIKIQPKSFDDEGGALVRLDFQPRVQEEARLHFSFIKKLFKKKLMHSFMALMLIIKMIKVKIMFLLPMIVGQSTAKKLLLKVLLFLIPGLAHLFKLCHFYHANHAKYHHHHHLVKHHHHHVKVPVPVPVPVHHHHEPPIHHHHESSGPGPYHEQSPGGDYYPPGPGSLDVGSSEHNTYNYPPVGSESNNVYNRHEYGTLQQYNDNEAEMSSWGLGSSVYPEVGVLDAKDQPAAASFSNYGYDNRFKKSPHTSAQQTYYPVKYQQQQQQQSNNALLKHQYATKLQALTPRPTILGTTIPVIYDTFYSPILQKIDNIFVQLGFNEEACRERLVCSMYRSPHKFSPHSNLLSAELSRDSKDLQKPLVNNSAVVRFYRYVQAARDGQSQKDCLRLYPSCTVNTEAG